MKLEKVKVNEKDGYTIFYDPERKLFCLEDVEGNEVATAEIQEKVEAEIPKIAKQAFKLPILAIQNRYSSLMRGRVTSLNLHQGTIYFAYDDKKVGSTNKVNLRYDKSIYELTEANERIVTQVEERAAQKTKLDEEILALTKQLEKPINSKYFGL